jgi:hypothetical protein
MSLSCGAHLLIEVWRPREVSNCGIDAPPEILKHHSGGCWGVLGVGVKVRVCGGDGASRGVLWGIQYGGARLPSVI